MAKRKFILDVLKTLSRSADTTMLLLAGRCFIKACIVTGNLVLHITMTRKDFNGIRHFTLQLPFQLLVLWEIAKTYPKKNPAPPPTQHLNQQYLKKQQGGNVRPNPHQLQLMERSCEEDNANTAILCVFLLAVNANRVFVIINYERITHWVQNGGI